MDIIIDSELFKIMLNLIDKDTSLVASKQRT